MFEDNIFCHWWLPDSDFWSLKEISIYSAGVNALKAIIITSRVNPLETDVEMAFICPSSSN